MKAKLYIYTGLIFLAGPIGMIFSKNLIVKSIGFLIAIVVCILIYFDKEYRDRYLPLVPNWYMIGAILLLIILFFYSLVL